MKIAVGTIIVLLAGAISAAPAPISAAEPGLVLGELDNAPLAELQRRDESPSIEKRYNALFKLMNELKDALRIAAELERQQKEQAGQPQRRDEGSTEDVGLERRFFPAVLPQHYKEFINGVPKEP